MATQQELEQISTEAIKGSTEGINNWLGNGVNYREAQLYVEGFHQNKQASNLILKQAHCSCGHLAIKWDPNPRCGNCRLHESFRSIEFK